MKTSYEEWTAIWFLLQIDTVGNWKNDTIYAAWMSGTDYRVS